MDEIERKCTVGGPRPSQISKPRRRFEKEQHACRQDEDTRKSSIQEE